VAAVQAHGIFDNVAHDGEVWALHPDGRLRWRTDLEAPGLADTWDAVAGVALGGRGGVYVTGHVDRRRYTSPDQAPPDEDVLIQALRRTGDVAWTRVLGDGAVRDTDRALDIAVRSRRVLVVGERDGAWWDASRPGNGWIGAFTTAGEHVWARRWGGGDTDTSAVAVAVASWGKIYIASIRCRFDRCTSGLRTIASRGAPEIVRHTSGSMTDVAATRGLFVTIDERLERWHR
jgi:hypothetical protein